jgi:hypothetical protein
MLVSRRKPGDTQEKYFYEWGVIHVALMITTPSVMQTMKRYAQHFSLAGITDDQLVFPLSGMAWDNFADHWLESLEDVVIPFGSDDYMQRMHPHDFGDRNFVIEFSTGREVHCDPGFVSGGVKLVHFLNKRPELTLEEFDAAWRERHAAVVLEQIRARVPLRKYVQSTVFTGDPALFKGTLFERADVGAYGGVEEFWFDDVADLSQVGTDGELRDALSSSYRDLVEPVGTFSLVTAERIVYDYTPGAQSSPRPAVLDPMSLEAAIDAQGYRGWNVPGGETSPGGSV